MKRKCRSIKGPLCGILIFLGLINAQLVSAQKITITGKVTDSQTKETLIGVTVLEKGTTNGALTDVLGNYSIEVNNANSTLVFSFVGKELQEIVVGGQKVIDVSMKETLNVLEEVVVTGYQTQRRADLTGSVSVAKISETKDVPTSNILKAVQGKVAGLYITGDGSPNQTTTVNVRGVNTLGNTNPLYIIDGAPTTDPKLFQSLDPSTIESFQILKDASAASIYGITGSVGFVVVKLTLGSVFSVGSEPAFLWLSI